MLKSVIHLPAKFTVTLYAAMMGRFMIYAIYGYAVALAFTYFYDHFVASGANPYGSMWQSCPFIPYVGIAYLLIIGFFVTRDSLEVSSTKIVDALNKRASNPGVK